MGLAFYNVFGRPLEPGKVLRRSFEPLLARADCPRVCFYDLRHTAATLLLVQGEHPKVAQERLGQSTIAVTMDVYSHVMPTMQRKTADRLEAMFHAG